MRGQNTRTGGHTHPSPYPCGEQWERHGLGVTQPPILVGPGPSLGSSLPGVESEADPPRKDRQMAPERREGHPEHPGVNRVVPPAPVCALCG